MKSLTVLSKKLAYNHFSLNFVKWHFTIMSDESSAYYVRVGGLVLLRVCEPS